MAPYKVSSILRPFTPLLSSPLNGHLFRHQPSTAISSTEKPLKLSIANLEVRFLKHELGTEGALLNQSLYMGKNLDVFFYLFVSFLRSSLHHCAQKRYKQLEPLPLLCQADQRIEAFSLAEEKSDKKCG